MKNWPKFILISTIKRVEDIVHAHGGKSGKPIIKEKLSMKIVRVFWTGVPAIM